MPAPQLREALHLLEQYALAEDRSQAAELLSAQLGAQTAAFLAGACRRAQALERCVNCRQCNTPGSGRLMYVEDFICDHDAVCSWHGWVKSLARPECELTCSARELLLHPWIHASLDQLLIIIRCCTVKRVCMCGLCSVVAQASVHFVALPVDVLYMNTVYRTHACLSWYNVSYECRCKTAPASTG